MSWVDHQRSYTRGTADAGDLEEIGWRGSENNSPDQNLKDLTRGEMLLVKGLQHYSRCVKHLRRCFTTFQNIAKFVKTVPLGLDVYSLLSDWKRGNMEMWVFVFSVNNILSITRLHLYSNYLYRRPNRLMAIGSVSQTETSENWRD